MGEQVRSYLSQYFLDLASWHSDASAIKDGDSSNHYDNARLLYALATYIGCLAHDDLRLTVLGHLTKCNEGSGFEPGPRLSAAIADIGYFAESAVASFLEYLVYATLDDQIDGNQRFVAAMFDYVDLNSGRSHSSVQSNYSGR